MKTISTICFYAQFTKSKVGVNSLTITFDIERITRSDGTRTALVTGGANSITVGRRGLYGYVLTGADLTLYDYVATAISSDSTLDLQEIACLWTLWSTSWHDVLTSALNIASTYGKLVVDNLNATITSRSVAGDAMALTTGAVDDVWDEVLTGATHNVTNSAGRRLRQLSSTIVWDGISQGSGVNGNQIILDVGASSIDGSYDPSLIAIVGGTGIGQCRLILQYEGSTRIATVDRTWKVLPDITSEFIIYADAGREHVNEGLAQGGGLNTIILNSYASSINDNYVNQLIFIRSGLGEDQVGLVTAYNGTTKVATLSENWGIIPDITSAYVVLPTHVHEPEEIATSVWSNSTRTLTSSNGGASAREIWEYETRTLTSWREIISDFWNAIPTWFNLKLNALSSEEDIYLYRGVTNVLFFTGNTNISGSSDITFTVKNKYTDTDEKAILKISLLNGLTVLNGLIYSEPAVDGSIYIINESTGEIKVTLENSPSEKLVPAQSRIYDIKSRVGNTVKLISRGKINILPDVTNEI